MKRKRGKHKYSLWSNLRYIYQVLYKKCPKMRLAVYGTVFISVICPIISTMTLAVAVKSITEQGSIGHYLIVMSGLIFIYLVCYFTGQYIGEWSEFYYENTQNREFLMKLVSKSLKSDYVNVESPAQQRLVTRAGHAVNRYRQGVNQMYANWPDLVASLIGLVLYALTISFFDWRILIVIVVMTVVGSALERNARKYRADVMDELYKIWGRMFYLKQQSISVPNGKDIRIYNMADWFRVGFDRLLLKEWAFMTTWQKKVYIAAVSDRVFIVIRDILAYGILTAGVIDGTLTIAEYTLGIGVVASITNWIRRLRLDIDNLLEGSRMLCEYRTMIDYPDRFLRETGRSLPKEWMETAPDIEFRHVFFRYEEDGEYILKDISFRIKSGEKLALVGHNGAGKTTLVKLLCGFYHPDSGEILIGGHPIETLNLDEYHDMLGTIFQDINSIPVSIASNISGRTEEETDMDRVRECLKRAGLWEDVEKLDKKELTNLTQSFDPDGIQLSGGMMQKLMLARVIYKNAPLMVLDEPTAALDPIAESNMYQEYERVTKGKSALFISHRLASTRFCDRILYMEHGQLMEEGTHEELLARNGKYAEVFEVQSKYYKEGGASDEQ